MFKGSSLSFRLYAGFAAVLLIVCLLGAFAYSRLASIRAEIISLDKESIPGIILTAKVEAMVLENEAIILKHILADKHEIEEVDADIMKHRQNIVETLKSYEKTIAKPKDRELFENLGRAREAYIAVLDKVLLPLSREGKKEEAIEVLHGAFNAADGKYIAAVKELHEFNVAGAEESGKAAEGDVASAVTGIVIGLLAALVAGAAVGIFLSRSISSALNVVINSLSSGSEQVSSASNQVSQSSQQMAEGASEQASSLEETSASLEELSSMTRQNSDNARQASTMATDTRDAVEKSREAMTRMGDAIGKIKGSSDQTAKIIKTIDEIAFQTNLLALNAAVEAARAGDAGKGFAVVAEEVRNLAQRSAEAAKSTAALIEESQQNANNGVAVSNEVAGILSRIVDSVGKLTQLIGEVSVASEEQSKGITQIGTAVTEMDKLTQANAANAEESASASEELAAQAKELGEMVTVLVGIVKGESARMSSAIGSGRPTFHPSAKAPALRAAAPKASKAAASAKPSHDWSPAPAHAPAHAPALAAAHGGKKAAGNGKALSPDQVIPMDDSDLKDF